MELKKYRLGDIATFYNGRAYSQEELLDKGKYRVLRVGNIFDGNKWYYSNLELDNNKYCNKGDLLYAWACTFGPYIWHEDKTIFHYHIWKIEEKKNLVDKIYLYYLLKIQTKMMMRNLHGSTMLHITKENMENYIVSIPPIDTQQKLASVLYNLDRKIALNRAINQNLEALAKQLYDYWFVQFDFPDENGKPYKSSGGKMVWNEKLKREIPEDWDVVFLSNYLKPYVEKVSPKNISGNDKYAPIEVLPRRKMSFCEYAPIEKASSGLCRFKRKHILLSNRRVYFHKVCIAAFSGLTRDTVIVLTPYSENVLGYAYQLVNDDVFIEYATRHSYGSEQPVLSWESAKMYKVLKPSNKLDSNYNKYINSIMENVLKNEMEIDVLTKQRDELLPLLMNGQVKID